MKILKSNQDISFKDNPDKDELSSISDYVHRHGTRAFMECAIGSLYDGEIHDSNYSLGLLAQESDYDVISCLWAIIFKCNQLLSDLEHDASPTRRFAYTLLKFVERALGDCAVLIDEGKLDSANRYMPECKQILMDVIDAIVSDQLDETEELD